MKELIDKSDLVAEIEKVADKPAPSHDQQCSWENGYYCGLYKVMDILDTLEIKESEDERIRKMLIHHITQERGSLTNNDAEDAIAWLKKQNEHKDYYTKQELIDMGFSFTLNGDIVTPNEMVADMKKYLAYKKQYEQKPIIDIDGILTANNFDKMFQNCNVHKFRVGDWISHNSANFVFKVTSIGSCGYSVVNRDNYSKSISFDNEEKYHLWSIADAKDGDVLKYKDCTFIFKKTEPSDIVTNIKNPLTVLGYCGINRIGFEKTNGWGDTANCKYHPATKEQRDLLFEKMHEAGYMWDAEKKKLKRIEEEYNDDDYGIDGLWHAQRILERTLGKVDGYQSDDGILSHKCAITAVKKLYAQKPTEWSEEDERFLNDVDFTLFQYKDMPKEHYWKIIDWLKSIKQRMKEK